MATEIIAPEYGDISMLTIRQRELPVPGPHQVLVRVRAVGVNPTDYKSVDRSWPRTAPMVVGFEAAGVVAALGAGVAAAGTLAVGDDVIVYPILGAYASAVLADGDDVIAKPSGLSFPSAANLLLVATTAAEMLYASRVRGGETVLVHGASGATGVSLLQQAANVGVRIVATASERNMDVPAPWAPTP